jgi:hypothetical protein
MYIPIDKKGWLRPRPPTFESIFHPDYTIGQFVRAKDASSYMYFILRDVCT